MNGIECMMVLLPYVVGILFVFAVGFPLFMIAFYKLCKSELSIKEILKRI